MTKTNIQIVQEFYEQVINRRQFDQIYDYYSPQCVLHNSPFIGFGLNFDDRDDDHLMIFDVAPNGPAYGKILPGDELIRVKGEHKVWDEPGLLRQNLWSLGLAGDLVTFTVRRKNELIDIPVVRGRVGAWDIHLSTMVDIWFDDLQKNWQDMKSEVTLIFGQDDLVACFVTNNGTNSKYHRTAIWGECNIFRLSDGKIVESWGMEDGVMQLKQLGYKIAEPEKEMA